MKRAFLLTLALGASLLGGCNNTEEVRRKHLRIVGEASTMPLAQIIAAQMLHELPEVEAPHIIATGSDAPGNDKGFALFCGGIGPRQEDLMIATRQISADEYARCASNNVRDIIEVPVGTSKARPGETIYLYAKALHVYGVPYLYAYMLGWRENWAPGGLLEAGGMVPLNEAERARGHAVIERRQPLDHTRFR